MKVPLHAAYAWLTILICGCGAQTLDAGSNADAAAVAPPSGVRWQQPPSNDLNETCTPGGSTSVVGSWLGHFDNYVFPSGSNEIRIDLIETDNPADGQNGPCGKIVFGGGDPPPLPTDPAAFYPPGSAPTTTIVLGDAGVIQENPPQRTCTGISLRLRRRVQLGHARRWAARRARHHDRADLQGVVRDAELVLSGLRPGSDRLEPVQLRPLPQRLGGPDSDGGCEIRLSGTSWTNLVPVSCAGSRYAALASASRTDAPSPPSPRTFTWTSSFKVTPARAARRFRWTESRPLRSSARHERDASGTCELVRRARRRAVNAWTPRPSNARAARTVLLARDPAQRTGRLRSLPGRRPGVRGLLAFRPAHRRRSGSVVEPRRGLALGDRARQRGGFVRGRRGGHVRARDVCPSQPLSRARLDRDTPGMHLRAGPWIGVRNPAHRVRGEGGLSMTLGRSTADMGGALGTFGLRVGAGYSTTGVLDAVGVLSWGARLVPARRASTWKAEGRSTWCAPGDEPWVAIAAVAYLFVSVRRSFDGARASEFVLGVELGWPDGRPR